MVGQSVECPHCKLETLLFIPPRAAAPSAPMPQSNTSNNESQAVYTMKGVNDLLHVYQDRVEITPEGFMGFISKGLKGTKTIPFYSINAIQFKLAGFTTGYIQFTISGGIESRGGVINAGTDENTFMFYSKASDGHKGNNQATEIKNYIEARIKDSRAPKSVPASTATASLGDELAKIAALKAQGVLSDEEFQAAKKRLIS